MFGSNSIKKILPIVLLVVLTALVYFPSLSGGFLLDDYPNIVNSSAVKIESLDYESLYILATSGVSSKIGRPISFLSFGLNYFFYGFDPFYFKIINLLIHIANAIILFVITSVLHKNYQQYWGDKKYNNLPIFLALLWAVHPINVSTTAYIVQRMTLLSATFTLLGVLFYLLPRLKISNRIFGQTIAVFLMLVFMGLGILSKENAVLLPLFILLIEKLLIPQTDKTADNSLIIFILIPTIIVSFYVVLHPGYVTKGYSIREFDIIQRLLIQPEILAGYIGDILLPLEGKLTFYKDIYKLPVVSDLMVADLVYPSLAVFFAVMFLVISKKKPIFAFGGGFFIAGHLLESTSLPLELAFEHRNYLPGVGVLLIVVLVLHCIFEKMRINWKVCSTMAVAFLLSQTYFHCLNWSNPFLLFESEVAKSPNSFRANIDLARIYAEFYITTQDKQHKVKAISSLKKAIELNENASAAYAYIIWLNSMDNYPIQNWVLTGFLKSLAYHPADRKNPKRVNRLITMYDGGYKLPENYIKKCIIALERNLIPYNNKYFSEVLTTKAKFYWLINKDIDSAVIYANEAIDASPRISKYYENRVELLLVNGLKQKAAKAYDKYKAVFPVEAESKYRGVFKDGG